MVLVGGFGVWGRDAFLGLKYWGGALDLQEALKARGFSVVTSEVGPVSSYWDRACELYAQILGRRVDYGEAHSRRFGHARWGEDWTGRALVPGWGGSVAKIHLVCHSMGGPTARLLAHLLERGDPEELAAAAGPLPADSLFSGGKRWISSIVSISSPHDGTTLTELRYPVLGELSGGGMQRFMAALVAMLGGGGTFYDFKLDQWGLVFEGDWRRYYERVMTSPLWTDTKDLASWDGSPEGSRDFNGRVETMPDVRYLSFATRATRRDWWTGGQVPVDTMMPLMKFMGFSQHMGSFTRREPGKVVIDELWWPNDGIVNTVSMSAPSGSPLLPKGAAPRPGAWCFMGTFDGVDHGQVIGLTDLPVFDFYLSLANLLASFED
jgi:triacylglycerol lipase